MRTLTSHLIYGPTPGELLAVLMAMVCAGFAPAVWAQTEVRTDIREDVVWTSDRSPYYVGRNITVSDGATLTIMPGTIVEFGFDDTIFIYDGAHVVADSAVFRPRSTAGFEPALYTYEAGEAGSLTVTNSTFEHLIVQSTGSGELYLEGNHFAGVAHVRLYSSRSVTVRRNLFEDVRPIWTEIALPASTIKQNVFAPESVLYLRHAQRVARDDTLRTYQGLPVHVNNDVTVTDGALLVIGEGTHVLQGHFHSFHVNGGAELRAEGARFSPAGSQSGGPSIIVSTGNGAGRATITGSTFEQMYVEFTGGSGTITRSNFLVDGGRTALRNTGTAVVDARHNYWNGAAGPAHSSNPDGDGALVGGEVDFTPWLTAPAAQTATFAAEHPTDIPAAFEIDALYPNPAADRLRLRVRGAHAASLEVYDGVGRLMRAEALEGAGEHVIDVSGLSNGTYYLLLRDGRQASTRSFIVMR